MDALLKLLTTDARLSLEQLASLTGTSETEVAAAMDEYRKNGVIAGYRAVVNYDKLDGAVVSSVIELRVMPEADQGFDGLAKKIAAMDEVDSVYLMSGGYDLMVRVTGTSFRDIAMFVATRLATVDNVQSTATHFVLKTFKENGFLMDDARPDERGLASL